MRDALFPVFNPDPDWWTGDICGRYVDQALGQLGKAARKRRVNKLEKFYSPDRKDTIRSVLQENQSTHSNQPKTRRRNERWYNPETGLKTVRALLDYVRKHPSKFIDSKGVIEDLEALDRSLSRAAQEGRLWHLGRRAKQSFHL